MEVENPAKVLRNQDGTFKVTSPYGHIFQVTCRKGREMRIREIGNSGDALVSEVSYHDYGPTARRWRIEKIG